MERLVDLIRPGMNNVFAVEAIEVGKDPRLEFMFRSDTDVAKQGASILEKSPSIRLSQETCFGVNTKVDGPFPGHRATSWFLWRCGQSGSPHPSRQHNHPVVSLCSRSLNQ